MIIAFPILIAIVGLLIWLFGVWLQKGMVAEIGRIIFFCGFLVFMVRSAGKDIQHLRELICR